MRLTKAVAMYAVAAALALPVAVHAENGVGTNFKAAPKVSQEVAAQRQARLSEKLQLIQTISASMQRHASWASVSAESRQWMMDSLLRMSLEKVRQMGVPSSFAAASDTLSRQRVSLKLLGDPTEDLVYVPFAPCRYIDTRNVGGKINGTRGFDIANPGDTYGGSASCNILTLGGGSQANTRAIAMNITLVDTSTAGAPGFATVRPAGATALTALVNWTVASAAFQLGNSSVVTSDLDAGVPEEFEILTSGAVHAIVDVFGVFVPPEATALDCTVVQTAGAGSAANNTTFALSRPSCPAGYQAVAIGCMFSGTPPLGVHLVQVGPYEPTGSGWSACRWQNQSGGAITGSDFNVAVDCCRVPGR
jgi:hypothetical protein